MKINIGCGATPTPGWVNYDNSPAVRMAAWAPLPWCLHRAGLISDRSYQFARVASAAGIRYASALRIPCAARSAEAVYSSHMLEHLDRAEARAFLAEARRVLVPGGVLRLAVPDLARIVGGYLESGDAGRMVESTHLAQERPRGAVSRVMYAALGPRRHLWMYDGRSLTGLLSAAGFVRASVMPPGETMIAAAGGLNLREREQESVYAEAAAPDW